MSETEPKETKMDVEEEVIYENLDNGTVLQKYKAAAEVANAAILKVMKECTPDKSIVSLCELGDSFITEQVKPFFKKNKKMQKGVAFPTSISVNNVVSHFSPNSDDTTVLKSGDVVRIDLGAHIDGYISVVATTMVLSDKDVDGKLGDAFACAQKCMEVAQKTVHRGNKNSDISKVFGLIAKEYDVSLAQGVLSHQLKRFVIDGARVIHLHPTPDQNVEEFAFEDFEVFAVDIVVTTGKGQFRETSYRPNIYKRNPEKDYHLKLKTSRDTFKAIKEKFDVLPFTLRQLDQNQRLGLVEIEKNGLIDAYPVLCESKGENVVHIKSTFFLMKDTVVATTAPLPKFSSDKKVQDKETLETITALEKSTGGKKKKKKKTEDKMQLE